MACSSSSSTSWPRRWRCSASSRSSITIGLVDGDVDHARALVVAVDAVAPDGGLDLVEVLEAEALERRHLVGEALLAVADAVGEAGLHEAAVASAGGRADGATLDEHDVAGRVALLGDERRPQPGVAAADDAEVAASRSARASGWTRAGRRRRTSTGGGTASAIASRWASSMGRGSLWHYLPAAMDLGIAGKRAAVAAASAGLGFGAAAALAAEGVQVVICGRDDARAAGRGRADRARLRALGGRRGHGRGWRGVRRRGARRARSDRHPGHERRRPAAGRLRVDAASTPTRPRST